MTGEPTYWQRRSAEWRPSGVVLWVGRHRVIVWLILAVWGVGVVLLTVSAVAAGSSLVVPILNLITWASQVIVWGLSFPRVADEWAARQRGAD